MATIEFCGVGPAFQERAERIPSYVLDSFFTFAAYRMALLEYHDNQAIAPMPDVVRVMPFAERTLVASYQIEPFMEVGDDRLFLPSGVLMQLSESVDIELVMGIGCDAGFYRWHLSPRDCIVSRLLDLGFMSDQLHQ